MSGPSVARPQTARQQTALSSLALDNLRAVVILLVLAFHSALAYLNFLPAAAFRFDSAPYLWRSFPIVDSHRWFGFDLFCAWQDVFLMTLFFFLSGLFVWPSLRRKGASAFAFGRVLRLGLPFALVVALWMPVANYPTYLQTAAAPGIGAYWRHFLALPFWPCGPMWFLWLLLAADLAAAGLYLAAPHWGDRLAHLSSMAGSRPRRWFLGLSIASAVGYVPLALAFGTSGWFQYGPLAFQLSRPLHYAVYFFAGAGIGAYGIERGLFAPRGPLAGHSLAWLAVALGSFALWLALTALTMTAGSPAPLALQALDDLSFVLACFGNCLGVLALALRFAARRRPALASLQKNAYGMYLVHYVFVVWLQYAFLPAGLPAIVKFAFVFAGTVLLSWATTAAIRRIPPIALIIGAGRPRTAPRAS